MAAPQAPASAAAVAELCKSAELRRESGRVYLLFPCSPSHLIQRFKKSFMKRKGIINFQVCRKMKDDLLISGKQSVPGTPSVMCECHII